MSELLTVDQLTPLELTDLNAIIMARRGPKPGNPRCRSKEKAIQKILETNICVDWSLVRAAVQHSKASPSSEPYTLSGVDREVKRLVDEGRLKCPLEEPSNSDPEADTPIQHEATTPSIAPPPATTKLTAETESLPNHPPDCEGSNDSLEMEAKGHDILVRLLDLRTEPNTQKDISLILAHRGHDGWSNLVSARQLALKLLVEVPTLFNSPCSVAWNHPSRTQNPIPVVHCIGNSGIVQFGNDYDLPVFEKDKLRWLHVFVDKFEGAVESSSLAWAEMTATAALQDDRSDNVEMGHRATLPQKRPLIDSPMPPAHRQSPSPPSEYRRPHQRSHASSNAEDLDDPNYDEAASQTHRSEAPSHLHLTIGSRSRRSTPPSRSTSLSRPSPLDHSDTFNRSGTEQAPNLRDRNQCLARGSSLNMALGAPLVDVRTQDPTPETLHLHRSLDPDPRPVFQQSLPPVPSAANPPPFTSHATESAMQQFSYSYHGYTPDQRMDVSGPYDLTRQLTSPGENGYQFIGNYGTQGWDSQRFYQDVGASGSLDPTPYGSHQTGTSDTQPMGDGQPLVGNVSFVSGQDGGPPPPSNSFPDRNDGALGQLHTNNPAETTQQPPIIFRGETPDQSSTDNPTGTTPYIPVVSSGSTSILDVSPGTTSTPNVPSGTTSTPNVPSGTTSTPNVPSGTTQTPNVSTPNVSSSSTSNTNVSSASTSYVQTYLTHNHGEEPGIRSIRTDTSRGKKPPTIFTLIQQVLAVNKLCDMYVPEPTDPPGSKGIPPQNNDPLNPTSSSTLIPVTHQDISDLVKRSPDWVSSCQRASRKLKDTEIMKNPANDLIKTILDRVLKGESSTAADEVRRGGVGKLTGLRANGPAKNK